MHGSQVTGSFAGTDEDEDEVDFQDTDHARQRFFRMYSEHIMEMDEQQYRCVSI